MEEDDLTVVDREFQFGDAIKRPRPNRPHDDIGTVVGVSMRCDLVFAGPDGETLALPAVPSTELDFVHKFTFGTYVVYRGCVGTVTECHADLNVDLGGGLEGVIKSEAYGLQIKFPSVQAGQHSELYAGCFFLISSGWLHRHVFHCGCC